MPYPSDLPFSDSPEFLIRKSNNTVNPSPAVFLIHGYGSNEKDLFSFTPELPENWTIFALRAPLTLSKDSYIWYQIDFEAEEGKWSNDEQAASSVFLISRFIEEAVNRYNLDPTRLALIGFSQGAVLGYAVALHNPRLLKALVALSGYMNTRLLPPIGTVSSSTHVYSSHGVMDQVIPVSWARRTPSLLEQYGLSSTYEEFPAAHGVNAQNFFSFRSWLQRHL